MGGMSVTRRPIGYTLQAANTNTNPTDATTYYVGSTPGMGAHTTVGNAKIFIPRTGTIKSVQINITNAGTLATTEQSTISVRVNNTIDYVVASDVTFDSALKTVSNMSMSAPVAAGDSIEIKWVTPTWVTNPSNIRFAIVIYVE